MLIREFIMCILSAREAAILIGHCFPPHARCLGGYVLME